MSFQITEGLTEWYYRCDMCGKETERFLLGSTGNAVRDWKVLHYANVHLCPSCLIEYWNYVRLQEPTGEILETDDEDDLSNFNS